MVVGLSDESLWLKKTKFLLLSLLLYSHSVCFPTLGVEDKISSRVPSPPRFEYTITMKRIAVVNRLLISHNNFRISYNRHRPGSYPCINFLPGKRRCLVPQRLPVVLKTNNNHTSSVIRCI